MFEKVQILLHNISFKIMIKKPELNPTAPAILSLRKGAPTSNIEEKLKRVLKSSFPRNSIFSLNSCNFSLKSQGFFLNS